ATERTTRTERIAAGLAAARPREGLPIGAQCVVLLALLRVGQDRVSLVDVLEPSLGRLVTRLVVWVVLPRELAEGPLDLGLARCPGHPQDLVIVLVLHVLAPSAGSYPSLTEGRGDPPPAIGLRSRRISTATVSPEHQRRLVAGG